MEVLCVGVEDGLILFVGLFVGNILGVIIISTNGSRKQIIRVTLAAQAACDRTIKVDFSKLTKFN